MAFHNVKIVGNRDMPLYLAEFKDLNALNTTVHTNLRTTANSVGVAKPMRRLILFVLKWKKANCAHTSLNILTAKAIIR